MVRKVKKSTRKKIESQVGQPLEDFVTQLYIRERVPSKEVAKIAGVSIETFRRILRELGVAQQITRLRIEDRVGEPLEVFLKRAYVDEELPIKDLANMSGASQPMISKFLKDLGINRTLADSRRTTVSRSKYSQSTKRRWQDPEFRSMMSEKAKQSWRDPEYREKQKTNPGNKK